MDWLLFVAVLLVVVAAGVWRALKEDAEKAAAKKAYQSAMAYLRADPTNPRIKESALMAGRAYYAVMRRYDTKNKGDQRVVLDEVQLMNEINAACAAAGTKVEVTNVSALSRKTIAEQIEELGKLFLAGVITAEEFERGKRLFLGAPVDKAASAVELLTNLHRMKTQGVLSESEFNAKKWEILSERLLPGRLQAAKL